MENTSNSPANLSKKELHAKLDTGKESMDEMLSDKIIEIMESIKQQTEFGEPSVETIVLTNQLQTMVAAQLAFRDATKEAEEALAAAEMAFVSAMQGAISEAKDIVESDPSAAATIGDSAEVDVDNISFELDDDDLTAAVAESEPNGSKETAADADADNVVPMASETAFNDEPAVEVVKPKEKRRFFGGSAN